MLLETLSQPFAVTNTTNVTTNGFTAPLPKNTVPSGTGILTLGDTYGQHCASGVILVPFGVGSDSNTFSMNVFGWRQLPGGGQTSSGSLQDLWVPVLLATFTGATLDSALPGIANTQEGTTQYFCSALTLGTGNSGVSVEVVSPGHANHQIAHALIDTKGFRFLEVDYSTGGSATSCNALWCKV